VKPVLGSLDRFSRSLRKSMVLFEKPAFLKDDLDKEEPEVVKVPPKINEPLDDGHVHLKDDEQLVNSVKVKLEHDFLINFVQDIKPPDNPVSRKPSQTDKDDDPGIIPSMNLVSYLSESEESIGPWQSQSLRKKTKKFKTKKEEPITFSPALPKEEEVMEPTES